MATTFEDEIRDAMRTAAGVVEPPVGELVDGGIARGRRLQRRRRAAVAGTGLCAVAVVAAGVVLMPQLLADGVGGLGVAGQRDVGGEPVRAEPEPSVPVEINDEAALGTLLDLLPPGDVSDERLFGSPWEGLRGSVGGAVAFDDGDGAGVVSISVSDRPHEVGCDHPSPLVNCEAWELDDGSQLVLVEQPEYTDGRSQDLNFRVAYLTRPDGLQIELRATNYLAEKTGRASRVEPVLSLDELTGIVTSDRWHEYAPTDERQAEVADERRDKLDRDDRFAADLGDGWKPRQDSRWDPSALPVEGNAASLPHGDVYVSMTRDVLANEPAFVTGPVCRGWSEKGTEWDPCIEVTTPSGEAVHLLWSRSIDDTVTVPQDGLTVMYERDDGSVVRVMLAVRDSLDATTPDRRAAVVAWMEGQVDAMIAAATADL